VSGLKSQSMANSYNVQGREPHNYPRLLDGGLGHSGLAMERWQYQPALQLKKMVAEHFARSSQSTSHSFRVQKLRR